MLLKICSKLLCLKVKIMRTYGTHLKEKKKSYNFTKELISLLLPKSCLHKTCGMLLYLRWNIMTHIMWFCGLLFLLPEALAAVSPTWLSHQICTHPHRAPTGISVPVPFISFFFPPFLVILPTSGINQGEAVFSQLDSSCNIRAEFRETAGKLAIRTILTHTHTHTPAFWLMEHEHSAKDVCLFLPWVLWYVCYRWGQSPPSQRSTAPGTEQGLSSSQTSQDLLQGVRFWVTSLLVSPPASWRGPSALSQLWERFGQIKSKPLSQASAAMPLWTRHLLNARTWFRWIKCSSVLQCHDSIQSVALKSFVAA